MQANTSDKTIFTIVMHENQILIALLREDRKKDIFLQVSDTIFSALLSYFVQSAKKVSDWNKGFITENRFCLDNNSTTVLPWDQSG